jgi:hypothetical protein
VSGGLVHADDPELAEPRPEVADALGLAGLGDGGLDHLEGDVVILDADGEARPPAGGDVRAVADHPALGRRDLHRPRVDLVVEERLSVVGGETEVIREDVQVAREGALVGLLALTDHAETGPGQSDGPEEVLGVETELAELLIALGIQSVGTLLRLVLGGTVVGTTGLDLVLHLGTGRGGELVHQETPPDALDGHVDIVHFLTSLSLGSLVVG